MARLLQRVLLSGPLFVWAQDWFNIPKHVSPDGDYTDAQLAYVKQNDIGVDGPASYVHWQPGNFTQNLISEGDKPMPNTKVLKPAEWSKKVGVRVVDWVVKDNHGTKTVLTEKGLQPATQYDYFAYWKLEDRPRKMALLIEDLIEDYRIYVGYLTPAVADIIKAFRDAGLPIFWSNWLRRPNDKLYGALDRYYGPAGVKSFENPMYVYAQNGSLPMTEIAPTEDEVANGFMFQSAHLSKFADVTDNGDSYLRGRLTELGVDTLVVTGAWTEDCILSTALDAADTENLDVVIVEDGVGTATPGHYPALEIMKATSALILKSGELVDYVNEHNGDEAYMLKVEKLPQILQDRSSSARHEVQRLVLTVPEVTLIVAFTMIASIGTTLAVQRAVASRSKKTYNKLADATTVETEP